MSKSTQNKEDIIKKSGLFNEEYYLKNYSNIKQESNDPLKHYINIGWKKGYNPSKYFNNDWYLNKYPDVKQANLNPLTHYLFYGKKEGRVRRSIAYFNKKPTENKRKIKLYNNYNKIYNSILFDEDWYLTQIPDYLKDKDLIIHYLNYGFLQYDPNKLFSNERYLNRNIDVKQASINPLIHYLTNGKKEHRPIYTSKNSYENTNNISIYQSTELLKGLNQSITLILCINNENNIKKTINSLLENTKIRHELYIINNCPENKKQTEYLQSLNQLPFTYVIHNEEKENNLKSINKLIKKTDTDVILLDENTFYACNWLRNLITTCYKKNFSVLTSIPPTLLPEKLTQNLPIKKIYKYAEIISQKYHLEQSHIPLINSNVIYIKRDTFNKIGLFDETINKERSYINFSHKLLDNELKCGINLGSFLYQEETCISKVKKYKKLLLKEFGNYNINIEKEFNKTNQIINLISKDIKSKACLKANLLYVTKRHGPKNLMDLGKNFKLLESKFNIFILTIKEDKIILWKNQYDNFAIIKETYLNKENTKDNKIKFFMSLIIENYIESILVRPTQEYLNTTEESQLYLPLSQYFQIPCLYELEHNAETITKIYKSIPWITSFENTYDNYNLLTDLKNKKIAVYTVKKSSNDYLKEPTYINKNIEYYCFTDSYELRESFWNRQIIDLNENTYEEYKLLPHLHLKNYDYSIWIENDIDIVQDLQYYFNNYWTNKGMLVVSSENKIQLLDSKIIIRDHHNQKIIKLMEDIYSKKENDCITSKDYDVVTDNIIHNQFFNKHNHSFLKIINKNQVDQSLNALDNKKYIIIPVYNAFEDLKLCINSVLKYTDTTYELILINDASPDRRIKPYLDLLNENYDQIRVIHNLNNKGFIKNVNIGISISKGDVVLLNSDTIVTPKWLTKLTVAAYSNNKIGTVTPVSNNSGAFSVPYINKNNEINPKIGLNETGNIIEKVSENKYLPVPTGNGFCMYIKRDAIYSVGLFDEIFGKGYCEENDYCMRLNNKGWYNIIDDSTYIYHANSKSFTDKTELIEKNREILDKKHPYYPSFIPEFLYSIEYEKIREKIKYPLENYVKSRTKRILYVIHEGTGGTLHTTIDLASGINEEYDIFILTCLNNHMQLWKYDKNKNINLNNLKTDNSFLENITLVEDWHLNQHYTLKQESLPEFKKIYYNLLVSLKIDLIHIKHLIRHTFDLAKIAKKLGIPIVLNFHDFYYICPSFVLVDDKNKYCRGNCTEYSYCDVQDLSKGQCEVPGGLDLPLLKTFIHVWRDRVKDLFDLCDVFVTTSKSTKEIYTKFYPKLNKSDFRIIEHGRDLKTPSDPQKTMNIPSENEPIKILFPGHLNFHKGSELIENIKKYDKDNRLEYHYLGSVAPYTKLNEIGENHGFYKRNEFCKKVNEINPSFIGILSIWPETYCHTVTESWSCGKPIISIDIGALGERIKANGGGWFISKDPKKAYEEIINISKDKENYIKTVNQIKDIEFKTISKMTNEYNEIYKKLLKKYE